MPQVYNFLKNNILKTVISIFLCVNILIRLDTFTHSALLKTLFISSIIFCLFIILYPKYLRTLLFVFGASFIFFGFHSHSIYNLTFELLVVLITIALFVLNLKDNFPDKKNKQLVFLLFLYVALSTFSLFILPLGYIAKTYLLLGLKSFAGSLFNAGAGSFLYPIAGINRLILFCLFALQLSSLANSKEVYKVLFIGILYGTVLSAILGLLDYYSIISLASFRILDPFVNPEGIQFRLQSTFGHPGWFAEFVTVTIPFVLIGFLKRKKTISWKVFLLSLLLISEMALFLAKARAGWVISPFILIFFWIFFYLLKEDNNGISWKITKKAFIKVMVSVPITILIGLVIIYQLLGAGSSSEQNLTENMLEDIEDNVPGLKKRITQSSLTYRTSTLFGVKDRVIAWKQGIEVGRESPFFGMGYESFYWHKSILVQIPDSYIKSHGILPVVTPHNLFLQLFVSGGFAGLFLWTLVIGYALILLLSDFMKHKNYFNIVIMLSITSFHLYGIFQSMQYIPMIWLLVFLSVGYAMTIDETVLSIRHRGFWDMITKICILIIIVSGFVYFNNSASNKLSKKYSLKLYAVDQYRDSYLGFYHPEKWSTGRFRWSRKEGILSLPGNEVIEITLHVSHPDIAEVPVTLNILSNKKPFDKVIFTKKGAITKKYYIPDASKNMQQLFLKVSRTWNPYKYGVSKDNRDLGIAVSEIKFFEELPEDGTGFYHLETWGGGQIPGWPDNLPVRFRWTGMRASMRVKSGFKNGITLFLLSSHPDINNSPVKVEIIGDDRLIREEMFVDNKWRKVLLKNDELRDSKVLTFQVSRTWNPKLAGISEDSRDLGIVVAIPEE